MIYQSKVAKTTKTFDALDWLARLRRITYIPNKGESAGGPEAFIIYDGFIVPSADDPPSLMLLRC